MTQPIIIDSFLTRAARALVQLSATDVAAKAGVSRKQLKAYEKGRWDFTPEELVSIQTALENYGAVFIEDDAVGGYGVRLKFNRSKTPLIERWEGEGGRAGEDDV